MGECISGAALAIKTVLWQMCYWTSAVVLLCSVCNSVSLHSSPQPVHWCCCFILFLFGCPLPGQKFLSALISPGCHLEFKGEWRFCSTLYLSTQLICRSAATDPRAANVMSTGVKRGVSVGSGVLGSCRFCLITQVDGREQERVCFPSLVCVRGMRSLGINKWWLDDGLPMTYLANSTYPQFEAMTVEQ